VKAKVIEVVTEQKAKILLLELKLEDSIHKMKAKEQEFKNWKEEREDWQECIDQMNEKLQSLKMSKSK